MRLRSTGYILNCHIFVFNVPLVYICKDKLSNCNFLCDKYVIQIWNIAFYSLIYMIKYKYAIGIDDKGSFSFFSQIDVFSLLLCLRVLNIVYLYYSFIHLTINFHIKNKRLILIN